MAHPNRRTDTHPPTDAIPHAKTARRTRLAWLAISGGLAMLATAFFAQVIRGPIDTTRAVVIERVIERPTAAAVGPTESAAALAPSVALPVPSDVVAGPLLGVAVSRVDRKTVAVWSETAIAVSRDAGQTFAVDHSVTGAAITAVAVDDSGAVHVLRPAATAGASMRLTTIRRATRRQQIVDPIQSAQALHAAAGHLFIHDWAEEGGARLWISSDGGGHWRLREIPDGNANNELFVDDDGTMQLVVGSEASCGGGYQSRYQSSLEADAWTEVDWPLDVPVGMLPGPRGWTYGVDEGCREWRDGAPVGEELLGLCGVGKDGQARLVHRVPEYSSFDMSASNGTALIAVIDETLLRLRGPRAIRLGDAPDQLTALAVDAAGRPLAVRRGILLAWSPRHKWQPLFPSVAALSMLGATID